MGKEREEKRNGQDYLLGSQDEELARLESQHRVWATTAAELWERADFAAGARLVDLGCGPGFASVDLARRVGPDGHVLAVDGSTKFLAHLQTLAASQGLANVEPLLADVEQVDLTGRELDGAYARWLFCFVRQPEAVVARVAAGLGAGGCFAIHDYFNYRAFTFSPRSEALDRVVAAVQACWRDRGGDLDIQGRMPRILEESGFEVTDVTAVCHVARPGEPLWDWPRPFFHNFLPTLLAGGYLSVTETDAFWQDWYERAADPSAFLFLPPLIDIVARRR